MILLGLETSHSLFTGKDDTVAAVKFSDYKDVAAFLRKMISQYRGNPTIREQALNIIKGNAEQKDKTAQALAIGEWAQSNLYYVHELPERFNTPLKTLESMAGDCDDFTTIIGALLESVGIRSQFVIMNIDGQWRHIFPRAVIEPSNGNSGRVVPLDATLDYPVRELTDPVQYMTDLGHKVRVIIG